MHAMFGEPIESHPVAQGDAGTDRLRDAILPDECSLRVLDREAADLRGNPLLEVFPDNPDDPLADGVSNLYASLTIAAETTRAHAMATQRYDICDRQGYFVQRYWRPINTPIHDDAGNLVALLHHVDDVTAEIQRAMGYHTESASAASRRT